MDIELIAEAGALLAGSAHQDIYAQIEAGVSVGWMTPDEGALLTQTYRLMWRLQSAARLLSGEKLDPDAVGAGGRAFLLKSNGEISLDRLQMVVAERAAAAATVIDGLLERSPTGL